MKNRNKARLVEQDAFRIVVTDNEGVDITFDRARAWTVQFWGVMSITREDGQVVLFASGTWRNATVMALTPQVM